MVSKSESSSTSVEQSFGVPVSTTTEAATTPAATTSVVDTGYNLPASSTTTDVLQGSAGDHSTAGSSTTSSIILPATTSIQASALSTSSGISLPLSQSSAATVATTAAPTTAIAGSTTSGSNGLVVVVPNTMSTSPSSAVPQSEGSSSAQPTDVSRSSSAGHDTVHQGTLAGAVVGAALGAALLAALLTIWICLGRNRRSNRRASKSRDSTLAGAGLYGGGSGRGMSEKELSSSSNQQWINSLPQSADDTTMRQAVKTLFAQIELHVDNYYLKKVHDLQEADMKRLEQLGCTTLPAPIVNMVAQSNTLLPTIAHAVGNLLLSEITEHEDSRASLLPAQLSHFPPKLRDPSLSPSEQTSLAMCYSQYKRSAAYLYPSTENDTAYSQQLDRASARIAEIVQSSFAPWQTPSEPEDAARRNCLGLCAATARLGCLIMSQPATYDFKWEQAQHRTDVENMLVLPSFWRTTDEQGQALRKPLRIVSATRR